MRRTHLKVHRTPRFGPDGPLTEAEIRAQPLVVTATCSCGAEKTFQLDPEAALRWRRGELIQNAFPDLADDDRERLISGTCPTCWDAMWADEE